MAVTRLKSSARVDSTKSDFGLTEADYDITYEGATLGTYEVNGYDDSDFLAVVWTGEALTSVEYATTRGWTYANGASVDATDEVKAAAAAWLAARDIESWNAAAAADALQVEKGREVEVYKGRKVPIGTTGTVIWIGPDKFKRGANRIGLKDETGEVYWTAESNVRVTDGASRITPLEEIVRSTDGRIKRLLEGGDWVSAYRSYGGNIAGYRWVEARGAVDALLAETGRTDITAQVAEIRAARDAEEATTQAARDAWEAELDKPKAERDQGRLLLAGVAAGIYTGEETDRLLDEARTTFATEGESATDGQATTTGATDGPGSLTALAEGL